LNISARIRRAPLVHGAMLTLVLSACGGGGSDTGTSTTNASKWPATGHYAVVLKASGSTAAGGTVFALSLVHPSTSQVEYVMDSTAASSNLGLTLYQGTYVAASNQFSALSPIAFVDAPNGTLRTTLLSATGSRPQQSTGPGVALCPGSVVASNFADPFASIILASSPGADGACGTADDGQVMIGFSSTGAPNATAVTGFLGFLRSSATGAPSNWLMTSASGAEALAPFGSGGSAFVVGIGTPGTTVSYAQVQSLDDTILYARNGALMAVGNGDGSIARRTLSTSTGPDGWKSAGNDANYAYAYLNSSTATSGAGTWRLVAVARTGLAVTTLATGAGSVLEASAVPGAVYMTVLNGAGGSFVDKVSAPTGAQTTLWSSPTSITAVEANPAGLNTVITVSSGASTAAVSLIDNQGNSLYSQNPGLAYGADSDAIDAASGFELFAGVYVVPLSSTTYMGGEPLIRIDAATKASAVMGTLPSGSDLGGAASERVFVTPILADRGFGGFFASRLAGTQIVSPGSAVYTFNPGQANSMVRTTSQVQ
jgi:hypothetical protein